MCVTCACRDRGVPPEGTGIFLDEASWENGRSFLQRHLTIDFHAHPGRFFMRGAAPTDFIGTLARPDPARVVMDMKAARLSGAFFATVGDLPVLGRHANGIGAVREFEQGEAWADYNRQLAVAEALFDELGIVNDAREAHRSNRLAGLLAVEGGDFIEGNIDRVGKAAARGVKAITLIHYRTNQIGDAQTAAPVHDGLTRIGKDVVRAMEVAGVLIDLSHASDATVIAATKLATRPMIMSHSNVAAIANEHPRLVRLGIARRVTETGGVIGCVAAGFGQAKFSDFVDTILRMIDQLGIEHVAIGTDMDFTFRSVMPTYADWPLLAGTLLKRGLSETEVSLVMGANAMRLLG